jgi:hypothetical protein
VAPIERKPLGDYHEFAWWSGKSRQWGPDDGWRAWFGGGVADALVTVINEHVNEIGRRGGRPAAIGCVPWLTSKAIADALGRLSACCVVVSKNGATASVRRRVVCDGLPNVLPNLRSLVPDAESTLIGPYSPMPYFEVGPLRVAGWREADQAPLLHAKLLVLGDLVWGEDEWGREDVEFRGTSLWWGSANWTEASAKHLEVGCWSTDWGLVDEATDFLGSVIAFSEPWDSECAGPEPNLVDIEYDDDGAMWEAAQHLRDD